MTYDTYIILGIYLYDFKLCGSILQASLYSFQPPGSLRFQLYLLCFFIFALGIFPNVTMMGKCSDLRTLSFHLAIPTIFPENFCSLSTSILVRYGIRLADLITRASQLFTELSARGPQSWCWWCLKRWWNDLKTLHGWVKGV